MPDLENYGLKQNYLLSDASSFLTSYVTVSSTRSSSTSANECMTVHFVPFVFGCSGGSICAKGFVLGKDIETPKASRGGYS